MASIQKRGPRKDGSYSYQVQWRDRDTKQPERWTFDDEAEAESWKRLLNANGQSLRVSQRVHDDGKLAGPSVAELMATHISELTDVGPYQMGRYESDIVNHFSEHLGPRKVVAVEYEDIVAWIKYMQGKGLSAKTIANQHGLLSATMTTAVRKRLRPDNPCKGVKLPKSTATEEVMRFITQDEWRSVIRSMDPHFVPFFQLLIGTGLRFGEATALKASDFDLTSATPTVQVIRAWKSNKKTGYYIGPPKTKKSKRTVSLAPSTVEAIRAKVEGAGKDYVFTLKRGGVMRSGSTFNRAWRPALIKAGYEPWESKEKPGNMPRIHDTRHSHASWMLQAGMEIFALSRRLGHESITTTSDRYSALMPLAHFTGAAVAARALEVLDLPAKEIAS